MRRFIAIPLLSTACIGGPVSYCPHADMVRSLEIGSIAWSLAGHRGSLSLAGIPRYGFAPQPCTGSFGGRATWGKGDLQAPLAGSLLLECMIATHVRIRVNVPIADLTATAPVTVSAFYEYDVPGESATRACEAHGPAKVTIRAATGGGARLPALVTPDFTRSFQIVIDDPGTINGKSNAVACSPLTFSLDTTVSVRAADLASQPDAICPRLG